MGQLESKNVNLPWGKNYIISYCSQSNIHEPKETPPEVDLSTLINYHCKKTIDLIYGVIYYKLKNNGYDLPIYYNKIHTVMPLNNLLDLLNNFSSPNHYEILDDVVIDKKCFHPRLKNIKRLISNGNILVGGLIIDEKLKHYLNSNEANELTDVVLIVGYNTEFILIKTTWTNNIINLSMDFIDNFKELWDINIKSPEDKFFAKINE